jgi:hypothetical protein
MKPTQFQPAIGVPDDCYCDQVIAKTLPHRRQRGNGRTATGQYTAAITRV